MLRTGWSLTRRKKCSLNERMDPLCGDKLNLLVLKKHEIQAVDNRTQQGH